MKAYKTYADCPVERWPANAQSTHIWIAQESVNQELEESQGFVVVDDAAFQSLVDAQDAWFDNQIPTTEKDAAKYARRSKALPNMLVTMATQNMDRVRNEVWTAQQLISLTQDAGVKEILSDLSSLSFEIAYGKIDSLTPEILTTEIKNSFKALLYANF